MKKETHTCHLQSPANCIHKIDGKLSFVDLCGGNSLDNEVVKCPNRYAAEIVDNYLIKEATNEP